MAHSKFLLLLPSHPFRDASSSTLLETTITRPRSWPQVISGWGALLGSFSGRREETCSTWTQLWVALPSSEKKDQLDTKLPQLLLASCPWRELASGVMYGSIFRCC